MPAARPSRPATWTYRAVQPANVTATSVIQPVTGANPAANSTCYTVTVSTVLCCAACWVASLAAALPCPALFWDRPSASVQAACASNLAAGTGAWLRLSCADLLKSSGTNQHHTRTTRHLALPVHLLPPQIQHDAIPGVSGPMLAFWFNGGFEGEMLWQGAKFPRFLLAHPRDHVTQDTVVRSPTPGSTQGATWNTMELFAATASECVAWACAWNWVRVRMRARVLTGAAAHPGL